MKPDEIKQWLEPEELIFYEHVKDQTGAFWKNNVLPAFKRLAACRELSEQRRELMEKHQWSGNDPDEAYSQYCSECESYGHNGHAPDCLWAKAIEKGE